MHDMLVTETDLRQAMRDPRYWQAGHPERADYAAMVMDGWQALAQGEAGGTRQVRVRSYRRRRRGQEEQVGSYVQTRRAAQATERPGVAAAPSSAGAPTAKLPIPPTFVAFIGGGGDAETGIVREFREGARNEIAPRSTEYFAHVERARVLARIAAQPAGTRIVLVGHSWGGDTAAQVAATLGQQGRPVATLITVDPVGRGLSEDFMRRVRGGASEWINIRATGGGWDDWSNMVAALGSRYGSFPQGCATRHIEAPFRHADFASLLRARSGDGYSGWIGVFGR